MNRFLAMAQTVAIRASEIDAKIIRYARDWLQDCTFPDMTGDEIETLPQDRILRAVDRHYEGGLEAFLWGCLPMDKRVVAFVESETTRNMDEWIAKRCFAYRTGYQKTPTGEVERIKVLRPQDVAPIELDRFDQPTEPSDDVDSYAVDGSPGSQERIAALAAYESQNAKERSASVLNDNELADRLVDSVKRLEGQLTPLDIFLRNLVAEGIREQRIDSIPLDNRKVMLAEIENDRDAPKMGR